MNYATFVLWKVWVRIIECHFKMWHNLFCWKLGFHLGQNQLLIILKNSKLLSLTYAIKGYGGIYLICGLKINTLKTAGCLSNPTNILQCVILIRV